MDGWLQGLIVGTGAAVLAALGLWGWSEWSAGTDASQADVEQAQREAKRNEQRQDCEALVAAWGAVQQEEFRPTYGDETEDVVENCRNLLSGLPE